MNTSGGGWSLIGKIGDPRYLPRLALFNVSTQLDPNLSQNWIHANYSSITGKNIMVGVMIGNGSNVGNFYQISNCDGGDASCWYNYFINQNDGDSFGAWILNGGSYGLVPSGCTGDQCPASGGDRDHSATYRVAIFGGDCHSSRNSEGDDYLNGFIFRDYGTATSPSRIGNQAYWSYATTGQGSSLNLSSTGSTNYGQGGTQYRNLWIK